MFSDWWKFPKILIQSGGRTGWVLAGLWIICFPFLAVVTLLLSVIFGIVQYGWLLNLMRWGTDARTSDAGIEVFSRRRGRIATYCWSNISQLRRIFEPPGGYWELVLTSGEAVPLQIAELDVGEFRAHGIAVHESPKFRHEYDHDG